MADSPVLAYKDAAFLDSPEARSVRILSEYLHPLHALREAGIHDTIVFFGSARLREDGPLGRYYREARELARLLTEWSLSLPAAKQRFIVCSGGAGGIMEAANRGAVDAGGPTVGFNIGLPHEQRPNAYVTPGLCFEFHYFFMRKLWFAHLARAIVVFPGGYGTLDELSEILMLTQTGKLERRIPILVYGPEYWREVLDLDAMVRHGMIARQDLELLTWVDDPGDAFRLLQERLSLDAGPETPAFARSRVSAAAR
ncbi:MAG TPA: LOG family protein [Polyangia bacterium]|nr:LOG family protein [Polyangia bacterium]